MHNKANNFLAMQLVFFIDSQILRPSDIDFIPFFKSRILKDFLWIMETLRCASKTSKSQRQFGLTSRSLKKGFTLIQSLIYSDLPSAECE